MNDTTEAFLTDTLFEETRIHPHQQELLSLIQEQLLDDTNVYVQTHNTCVVTYTSSTLSDTSPI